MTAALTPNPKIQFFADDGTPLVGGKLYTYAAGTTTPLASYTTYVGDVANTNPVILDSRGEANVWLTGVLYKLALYDADDALIWTVDNVSAVNNGIFSGPVAGTTGTFSGALTAASGAFSGPVSGTTGTFSGAVSGTAFTGNGSALTALNASNLVSGTVPDARFPATLPVASGVNLTNLPAGNLTGDVAQARLATALNASGAAPLYAARAWVNFNGTGTIAIRASGNVSSLTDNGVGDYTVNFTTVMPDANYAPVGLMAILSGNEIRSIGGGVNYSQTASSLRVQTWGNPNIADANFVTIAIFR
jgi:hypothetical protein